MQGTGSNMQGLHYIKNKEHIYSIQIFGIKHITFHEADSGLGKLLHQPTHEELTAKILCTNEGTVF